MKTARFALVVAVSILTMAMPSSGEAKGCIKGAIVGGIAGHFAGHGKAGVVAGCVIGRHEANKADAEKAAHDQNNGHTEHGSHI